MSLTEIYEQPASFDPATQKVTGVERIVDEVAGTVTLRAAVVPLDAGELAAIAAEGRSLRREERDAAMPEPLNILSRHRNQKDYGIPTTLTDEQAAAWAIYLQGLRDYPETGEWPNKPA